MYGEFGFNHPKIPHSPILCHWIPLRRSKVVELLKTTAKFTANDRPKVLEHFKTTFDLQ